MNTERFRTLVTVKTAPELITPDDGVLFMGSCFAGNMGKYMSDARFPVLINPFGVLYNPFSIAHAFNSLINNIFPAKSELSYLNGLWHSFHHHGQFSQPNQDDVVQQIKQATETGHCFLQNAKFLIITFGTSYVYEHKNLHQVVANCHKFPDTDFTRYLLEPEEIIETYKDLIVKLKVFNPGLNIIFTISPVRHLKDGAHGNQVSKAVLLLAVEKLTTLFEKVFYFPAYEIVLDELRDYRFFNEAMTQPNEIAVKYIWERFMEATFSNESHEFYKLVQKVVKARNHRHSGYNTAEYRVFLQNTLILIDSLYQKYPKTQLDQDRAYFIKENSHF